MKCILIYLLIVCGGFGSEVLALRCASPDGLSVDEVRRVVKKCMKKVIDDDYQEYENFDDDYEMPSRPDHSASNSQTNSRNDNNRGNSNGPSYNQQTGPHYEPQAGGNYYGSNTKNNRRDHFNSYQFTYNNNNQLNGNRNQNNDGHRNDSSDKHERDQSCILQCFFQELKMVLRSFLLLPFLMQCCALNGDAVFSICSNLLTCKSCNSICKMQFLMKQ